MDNYQKIVAKGLICCIAVILCFCQLSYASDIGDQLKLPGEEEIQIIKLHDGTTLVGKITEIGDTEIKFSSNLGESTIAIDKIDSIRTDSDEAMKGGKYWFPNPNRTRLYFSPTGKTLRKGEGYFSDIYLFFPSVAYGLTDNISISGGMSLFPGLGFDEQFFYITPKIGVQANDKVALAASAIIIRIPDLEDGDTVEEPSSIGVLFGTATLGDDDKNITFGVGFGYVEGDIADKPAVLVGGEYRFSRRVAFVTENWIFPEIDDPIVSYGVRFFGENIAVDLALFNILDEDAIFPGVPYIGFVYNF